MYNGYSVCNIAIEPGADWTSLPKELPTDRNGNKERVPGRPRDVRYSRIDGSKFFRTATTMVAPNSQGSTVIHPTVGLIPYSVPASCKDLTEIWFNSKSVYSPFVSALGHRASRTVGSSCPSVRGRSLSCAM